MALGLLWFAGMGVTYRRCGHPKLFVFVACEQVITSQGNSVSLINLPHDIVASVPAGSPANAVALYRWCVYAQWHQVAEDTGKHYAQRTPVEQPDGTVSIAIVPPLG